MVSDDDSSISLEGPSSRVPDVLPQLDLYDKIKASIYPLHNSEFYLDPSASTGVFAAVDACLEPISGPKAETSIQPLSKAAFEDGFYQIDMAENNDDGSSLSGVVPEWKRASSSKVYSHIPFVALHEELIDFWNYLKPTQNEKVLRGLALEDATDLIQKRWPVVVVSVYGSSLTGMETTCSDLDLCISNLSSDVSAKEALTLIAQDLVTMGLTENKQSPTLLLETKVPLVEYVSRMGGIEVDICVAGEGDGVRNGKLLREYFQKLPAARPLITFLKYYIKQFDLHKPFTGGLGGFGLSLLVLSFLLQHPISYSVRLRREAYGLGRLLVDFLYYHGFCVDLRRYAVTITGPPYLISRSSRPLDPRLVGLDKSPSSNPAHQERPAIILDPTTSQHNVGASFRNVGPLKGRFRQAYTVLTGDWRSASATNLDVASPQLVNRPTLLSRIIHPDPQIQAQRDNMNHLHHKLEKEFGDRMSNMLTQIQQQEEQEQQMSTHQQLPLKQKKQRRSTLSRPPSSFVEKDNFHGGKRKQGTRYDTPHSPKQRQPPRYHQVVDQEDDNEERPIWFKRTRSN